jgi:hypothetical protein
MSSWLTFPGVTSPLVEVVHVLAALVLLPVSAVRVVVGAMVRVDAAELAALTVVDAVAGEVAAEMETLVTVVVVEPEADEVAATLPLVTRAFLVLAPLEQAAHSSRAARPARKADFI